MLLDESPDDFAQAGAPKAPRALMWDASNRNQVLTAAFAAHAEAMRAGFMPDEATTLSLTIADLGTNAVHHARGGVVSLSFHDQGWRLEVGDSGPGFPPGVSASDLSVLRRGLSSVVLLPRPGGGSLVVAEYLRPQQDWSAQAS